MDNAMNSLSPDFFKTLFTGITDAVTVIDRDFRIVWANDRRAIIDHQLRVLAGKTERARAPKYTLQEMVGHHCYEKFRRRATPCPGCPSVTAFKTGKPCVVERQIDLPTGLKRWGETRAYPVFGKKGEVEYVVKLSVEITKRKMDEEREGRRAKALARVLKEVTGKTASPEEGKQPLTGREKEVLCLVARGLTNPEVSRVLSISPHTVKRHVVNIFAKLEVRDRSQAALWAARHHLV